MNRFTQKIKPFIVVLAATIVLGMMSFFDVSFKHKKITLKDINIYADIQALFFGTIDSTYLLSKPQRDTIELRHLNIDTLNNLFIQLNLDSVLEMEKKDLRITSYSESSTLYAHFFAALKQARDSSGKTRIGYFGDSMIEGDLISQSLRNDLQNKFGGKGVGFVPITSIVSQFRRSIIHEFSDDWQEYSIVRGRHSKNFSPAGFVYNPKPISTKELLDNNTTSKVSYVSFIAPYNMYPQLTRFYTTKLFYGIPKEGSYIKYFIDGAEHKAFLEGDKIVNTLVLNEKNAYNELYIEFYTDTVLDVYGLSFESPNGVFVDNFAVRGNLGMALQKVPGDLLQSFNNHMDYSLLIFQFGLNAASPETKSFKWYEEAMVDVVNYYRKYIPDADVLVISIGDKSIKDGMSYVTQPTIPLLVEAQRNIARRTESTFWNLFQAMGGYNAMVSWVEAPKPLAAKDYAHINFRGAEKISNMLSDNIVNEFNFYQHKLLKTEEKELLENILKSSPYRYYAQLGSFNKIHKNALPETLASADIQDLQTEYVESMQPTTDTIAVDTQIEEKPIKEPLAKVFVELPQRILSRTVSFYGIYTKRFSEKDTLTNYITKIASPSLKDDIHITHTDLPTFRVQFIASKRPLGRDHYAHVIEKFGESHIIISHDADGYIRYLTGEYATFEEAQQGMQKMSEINQEAFITAWHKGLRISTEKANRLINKK